jgi:hypothetical protein
MSDGSGNLQQKNQFFQWYLKMDPEIGNDFKDSDFLPQDFFPPNYQALLDRNLQLSKRLEQVTCDYQAILKQAQNVNIKYENTIRSLTKQLELEKRANLELRNQLDFTDQIKALDDQIEAVDKSLQMLIEKRNSFEITPLYEPLSKSMSLPKKEFAGLSAQEFDHNRTNQELLKRRQRVNRIAFQFAMKDPRFQSGHAQFSHSKEYHCKLRQANKEWKEKIYKLEQAKPGYIDQKYHQLAAENGWPLIDIGEDPISSSYNSEVDGLEKVL